MFQSIPPEAKSLIRQGHRFSPVYGARLSNHLPMALIAMSRLGACEKALHAEYQQALGHLEVMDALRTPAPLQLGNKEHNAAFIAHYRKKLEIDGVEATLTKVLATLLPGMAAGSFHALIRLAYAIESADLDEISHALAYWSSGYTTLGDIHYSTEKDAASHLNQALEAMRDHRYNKGIMIDHVEELAGLEKYRAIASQPVSLSKEQVAAIVLNHYAASNDFTLLHGVTGFHALLSLAPYIDNFDFALDCFWQAYVAAACSADYRKPLAPRHTKIKPDWRAWFQHALATRDDHTIKLVYSCARLYNQLQLPEALDAVCVRLEGTI